MEIFKKPSDLLNVLFNNKALLIKLEKEYEGKIKGEIYKKTRMYYSNRILSSKQDLNNYCLKGSSRKINLWELEIETEVAKDITMNKRLNIWMDDRLNSQEVEKLIKFNLNCVVLSIKKKDIRINIGEVNYL